MSIAVSSMQRKACKYVWDAWDAAQNVVLFVENKTFDDYVKDIMLRSAVERQLEIVGEALNQLSRQYPADAARIPQLPSVVGFRNMLAHQYSDTKKETVWDVVQQHLPSLSVLLRQILDESPPPGA